MTVASDPKKKTETVCPVCKGPVQQAAGEDHLWWCGTCTIWWGFTLRVIPDRRHDAPDPRPEPRSERRSGKHDR